MIFLCIFILVSCQKTEITEEKAAKLAKEFINNNRVNPDEIIYFDSPNVVELEFEETFIIYYSDKQNPELQEIDLKGKTVWKVIYTTDRDSRLGPHTIYLDRYTGKIYGFNIRM